MQNVDTTYTATYLMRSYLGIHEENEKNFQS